MIASMLINSERSSIYENTKKSGFYDEECPPLSLLWIQYHLSLLPFPYLHPHRQLKGSRELAKDN